ncbi:ribonucleoside-triphosphate reductase [Allochromatium warmingii]|uniref:Ribonucleoside-triphosphate reductase n=1 Tax=Allochromatium warmingii TaxID=61595 RepID=A0A1H3HF13_ALLWA|nr:ribonucleoside triphosphate reductase [Allochromatium warmingii]SDY13438.1 ribonucleoside-triphosphate reductase [Allochromatium warmingii]
MTHHLHSPTPPSRVLKRDGQDVRFDASKIESAIRRAGQASGEFGTAEASLLTAQAIKVLAHRFSDGRLPDIENIQDIVEQTLIAANHFETARAYIIYREQRKKLRTDSRTVVDVGSSINEYLDRSDWRVAANANQGYSLGGLILNTSGKMIANYWLNHVYPPEIGTAHREGDLHIHDLDMLSGYCAGWSLRTLLYEGLNGVPGKVEAAPPKHMSSAIGQIVNFLGTLQNEWAGAQAFSSFDTYMAPYVRVDKLPYKQVKQYIQELIYNLNVPSRWGTQCVDAETECLTEHGWKRYDQIQPGEKIATFDYRNNRLEYLEPLAITAYDFDGDMYVLRNRTQEQWITPRHKVVRKVFNSDNHWVLEEIEQVAALKSPVIIPNAWETSSESEIDDKLVMLLAWIVAEGHVDVSNGQARIHLLSSLGNAEHAAEIEWLLHELGLSWDRHERTGTDANAPIYRYGLRQDASEFVLGYLERKCVPDMIRTLSARQIRLFLETYIKGDGHIEENGHARIDTKDRDTLDALQELCALAGYGSTIHTRKDSGVHVLNIVRNRETYIQLIERKPYQGKVWCPTTRNGTFVARRRGKTFITGNTPFTNLTFDWVCPDDLREQVPIIGGVEQPFTYGELQAEMDMINRAYIEVMTEGDAKGRVFTFPIPTYNITDHFPWESENINHLFKMTAKFGLPYFSNFISSDMEPHMVRSMCCRLRLDVSELLKRGNGLFGSAEQTGSLGVVTINCARLGYTHRGDEAGLMARLDELLDIARNSLEIKRKVIQRHMDAGLFPYTKRYLGTLRNHFSTIGVNGINEMIRNFTRDAEDITTPKGHDLACRLLDRVRVRMVEFQEMTGNLYNLEATPAEGTTYRFAREDQKRFPNMLQAGTHETPYYTNSSQLPVGYTDDPFEALAMQETLQSKYTGGTVLHLYMSEQISSTEACKRLVRRALENFRLPYITITPVFSICPKHGYIAGEHQFCPICDQELIARKRQAQCASADCQPPLLN